MGEHFYTTSPFERDNLEKGGWKSERVEWIAPEKGTAVYRLYNPNARGAGETSGERPTFKFSF